MGPNWIDRVGQAWAQGGTRLFWRRAEENVHFWAMCSSALTWITPNGQAVMQSRQPLHTGSWMYTVSNSVRTIDPVGHTSRHGAFTQCLHTSDIISQRAWLRSGLNCS